MVEQAPRCPAVLPSAVPPAYAHRSSGRRAECKGDAVVIAPRKRPIPIHPALIEVAEERARSAQNRIADTITTFAGSMWFVYLHIVWFSLWVGLRVERYPFGLLTMIVSLEAIFLATFVMIS